MLEEFFSCFLISKVMCVSKSSLFLTDPGRGIGKTPV